MAKTAINFYRKSDMYLKVNRSKALRKNRSNDEFLAQTDITPCWSQQVMILRVYMYVYVLTWAVSLRSMGKIDKSNWRIYSTYNYFARQLNPYFAVKISRQDVIKKGCAKKKDLLKRWSEINWWTVIVNLALVFTFFRVAIHVSILVGSIEKAKFVFDSIHD